MPGDGPPRSFDLRVTQHCREADGGSEEVVVCGTVGADRYRLRPLASGYGQESGVPRAQTSLGGGKLAATTQQVMIGGVPSNRIMVSIKLPF